MRCGAVVGVHSYYAWRTTKQKDEMEDEKRQICVIFSMWKWNAGYLLLKLKSLDMSQQLKRIKIKWNIYLKYKYDYDDNKTAVRQDADDETLQTDYLHQWDLAIICLSEFKGKLIIVSFELKTKIYLKCLRITVFTALILTNYFSLAFCWFHDFLLAFFFVLRRFSICFCFNKLLYHWC